MPGIPTFTAAIFDLDGLLIDSERVIMREWLRVTDMMGDPLTETEYVPVIGLAAPESDAHLIARLGSVRFAEAADRVNAALTSTDGPTVFQPKVGAHDILARMHALGVPCGVASSTATEEVERRLRAVNLRDYFRVVVGGDKVARGKPDPALYLRAAELLASAPAQCLAFEDSENGVKAAVAAGVEVVLVPDIKPPTTQMRRDAFIELASLEDAIPRLQEWFGH